MKKYFLILALVISSATYSQDLPTEPANGFAFPLGTKFTIKMHPTDSTNFDYSVIKLEPFQEIVDTYENDSLFKDFDEKNGTIEFYFCLGTSGETDEEKEKNMKVLLLMKTHSNTIPTYKLKKMGNLKRLQMLEHIPVQKEQKYGHI